MMEYIQKALSKYWGYDGFLPLQEQAMACISRGADSIVVLPTGGGKSPCFQAPAVTMPGLAVVVSPLISLMKDQVDALKAFWKSREWAKRNADNTGSLPLTSLEIIVW